jgi:hypothetical protein
MTDSKVIVPVELRVCATCTYWDGARSVDEDVRLVVVCESCKGECLVRESSMPALRLVHGDAECLWDAVCFEEPLAEEDRAHKL